MKERKENSTAHGGFTLVELVVVIAILGILAGVAYPAYTGYIKRANNAKVLNTLSSILTICESAAATVGEDITTVNIYIEPVTIGGEKYQLINVNQYGSSIWRPGNPSDIDPAFIEYINSMAQLSGGLIEVKSIKDVPGAFIACEKIPELNKEGDLMDTSYYDQLEGDLNYLRWTEKNGWQAAAK